MVIFISVMQRRSVSISVPKGMVNLQPSFDDTNPVRGCGYVDSIMEDIQWLGFQWKNVFYADYFQQLWDFAVRLIKEEAYVDEQSAEEIAGKGTPRTRNAQSLSRPSH